MSLLHFHPVYLTPKQRAYLEKHPMHTWKKFTPIRRAIEAAYDEPYRAWEFSEMVARFAKMINERPDCNGRLKVT